MRCRSCTFFSSSTHLKQGGLSAISVSMACWPSKCLKTACKSEDFFSGGIFSAGTRGGVIEPGRERLRVSLMCPLLSDFRGLELKETPLSMVSRNALAFRVTETVSVTTPRRGVFSRPSDFRGVELKLEKPLSPELCSCRRVRVFR